MTQYWMMKSEPDVYGIDHLEKDGVSMWEGVRNYQARNFMRDGMKVGDMALFYHSNAKPPGVAGLMRVCKEAYPDHTALDEQSKYFDAKASKDKPIWEMVDVEFVEKFEHYVSLEELKEYPELEDMLILKKGNRLSITPLEKRHFDLICKLGRKVAV